ncbi:transposase [Hydrogenophilus thermoluteolus]|nr:transposase [Hydrogenophilus thermoluteolus]
MTPADELEWCLTELTEVLSHADRHAGLKDYCRGLLLPIARKSIEPIAAHLDPERVQAKHQALHHFVSKSPWSDEAVLRKVREIVFLHLALAAGVPPGVVLADAVYGDTTHSTKSWPSGSSTTIPCCRTTVSTSKRRCSGSWKTTKSAKGTGRIQSARPSANGSPTSPSRSGRRSW